MLEGPRAAKPDELPAILDLVNKIFMSPRGRPPIVGEIFTHVFNERNLENLRVIVYNGKPVSHVGLWEGELLIYGSWFKVAMMGAVCTHPDFRSRGYASSLVSDALSKVKQDGIDLILISGSRNLYKRVGCFRAGRIYRYRIPAGKINSRKKGISIIPYEEKCLSDLVEIYQREPVRYRRSFADFKMLVERGFRCPDIPLKISIARIGDTPLAYIATNLFPDEVVPRVWEYAGSRDAVLHLIDGLFEASGSDVVEVTIPFQDRELLCLLEEKGLEKPPVETPASMRIVNLQSFLEKAESYLEENLG